MIAPTIKECKKTGAVLVIGGGIAGVQASLDLAEAGQKVYLLENSPAIGGNMARLDKTFPTNDCSMCILSPKIVECGRHRNIELITLADLESLEGDPGNFKVKIKQRARYVDPEKCTGCGLCLENCPTQNMLRVPKEQKPSVEIEPEHAQLVEDLLEEHGTSQKAVVRILQEINSRLRYLPEDTLRYLARRIDVPVSVLYRIVTFYESFSLTPRGKYIISVCAGTACHIKGAPALTSEMKNQLKIELNGTTDDRLFSLEAVRCLGCCSLAPAIKINDKVYGNVKTTQIAKILKDYQQ